MQGKAVSVLLLLLVVAASYTNAQEDLKLNERQVIESLAAQILRVAQGSWSSLYARKRNSELINSILGIPKVMKDAGK